MLEQSMLARDRRRETTLIAITSVLLLAQLSMIFLPISVNREQVWVNLIIGSCSLVFTVIWVVIRSLRLKRRRPFAFLTGMFLWGMIAITVVSAPFLKLNPDEFIPLSPASLFLIFIGIYSFLSKFLQWRWFREIGWPMCKSIHWFMIIPFVILDYLYLLSSDQLYAFSGLIMFAIYRYSFNRWIYSQSVHHPFRKTAAKFYIKQMKGA